MIDDRKNYFSRYQSYQAIQQSNAALAVQGEKKIVSGSRHSRHTSIQWLEQQNLISKVEHYQPSREFRLAQPPVIKQQVQPAQPPPQLKPRVASLSFIMEETDSNGATQFMNDNAEEYCSLEQINEDETSRHEPTIETPKRVIPRLDLISETISKVTRALETARHLGNFLQLSKELSQFGGLTDVRTGSDYLETTQQTQSSYFEADTNQDLVTQADGLDHVMPQLSMDENIRDQVRQELSLEEEEEYDLAAADLRHKRAAMRAAIIVGKIEQTINDIEKAQAHRARQVSGASDIINAKIEGHNRELALLAKQLVIVASKPSLKTHQKP